LRPKAIARTGTQSDFLASMLPRRYERVDVRVPRMLRVCARRRRSRRRRSCRDQRIAAPGCAPFVRRQRKRSRHDPNRHHLDEIGEPVWIEVGRGRVRADESAALPPTRLIASCEAIGPPVIAWMKPSTFDTVRYGSKFCGRRLRRAGVRMRPRAGRARRTARARNPPRNFRASRFVRGRNRE